MPWRSCCGQAGNDPSELAKNQADEERQAALEKQARAEGRGKGRHELLLSQTGQEDPKQTIQRITSAALRVSDPTEENTRRSAEALMKIWEAVQGWAGRKDNRDNPPKED